MKKILVIGASSGIGLEVVKQALQQGYGVRAFARSADRIALADDRLEKVNGNALNRDDVAGALDGVGAVIMTLGVAAGPGMVLGPVRLFSDSTRILIAAMSAAGIKRLICVTGYGAGDSRPRLGYIQGALFTIVLGRAYDDKSKQEALIRASGLDWVIARPVILTDGSRKGTYAVLDEPQTWRNGLISRADVADFLLAQLESDTYLRKTPVLAY